VPRSKKQRCTRDNACGVTHNHRVAKTAQPPPSEQKKESNRKQRMPIVDKVPGRLSQMVRRLQLMQVWGNQLVRMIDMQAETEVLENVSFCHDQIFAQLVKRLDIAVSDTVFDAL
jgi:hypothetical protein